LGDDLELTEGYEDDDEEDQNPAELLSVEPQIIMDDDDDDDSENDEEEYDESSMAAAAGMEHFLDASSPQGGSNSDSGDGMMMGHGGYINMSNCTCTLSY
jgi:hypothetical protein